MSGAASRGPQVVVDRATYNRWLAEWLAMGVRQGLDPAATGARAKVALDEYCIVDDEVAALMERSHIV